MTTEEKKNMIAEINSLRDSVETSARWLSKSAIIIGDGPAALASNLECEECSLRRVTRRLNALVRQLRKNPKH